MTTHSLQTQIDGFAHYWSFSEKTWTKTPVNCCYTNSKQVIEVQDVLSKLGMSTMMFPSSTKDQDLLNMLHQPEIQPLEKPPLGLRPKFVANLCRIEEISAAMQRYADVDKPIPIEWIDELVDLINHSSFPNVQN